LFSPYDFNLCYVSEFELGVLDSFFLFFKKEKGTGFMGPNCDCGLEAVQKMGKWGPFYGCSRFKRVKEKLVSGCLFTANIHRNTEVQQDEMFLHLLRKLETKLQTQFQHPITPVIKTKEKTQLIQQTLDKHHKKEADTKTKQNMTISLENKVTKPHPEKVEMTTKRKSKPPEKQREIKKQKTEIGTQFKKAAFLEVLTTTKKANFVLDDDLFHHWNPSSEEALAFAEMLKKLSKLFTPRFPEYYVKYENPKFLKVVCDSKDLVLFDLVTLKTVPDLTHMKWIIRSLSCDLKRDWKYSREDERQRDQQIQALPSLFQQEKLQIQSISTYNNETTTKEEKEQIDVKVSEKGKTEAKKNQNMLLTGDSLDIKHNSVENPFKWDCSKLKTLVSTKPFIKPRISWFKAKQCFRLSWIPGAGKRKHHNLPRSVKTKSEGNQLIKDFERTQIDPESGCLKSVETT
jgi:hypothetical protein